MLDILSIFYLFSIGVVSGIAAGLLGIGGGLIIVPLLMLVFSAIELPLPENHIHIAIATSLATIIFTAISAIIAQQQRKHIIWPLVFKLLPGIILGSYIGAISVTHIPQSGIIVFFSLFLLWVAWKMWFIQADIARTSHPDFLSRSWLLYPVSLMIGSISAILGIGGGTMTVPYLSRLYKGGLIGLKKAVAISSTLGLPIALSASFGFYLQSKEQQITLDMSWGYVYVPAFIIISLTTLISTRFGVSLLHRLNRSLVSRLFALLLVLQAVQLLFHYHS